MAEIDPDAPLPPYRQIAAWIAERIASGEFPPGKPIPSEKTLGQEFPVARDTIRRAIAYLREQGLVFTVPQRGTFVKPRDEDATEGTE